MLDGDFADGRNLAGGSFESWQEESMKCLPVIRFYNVEQGVFCIGAISADHLDTLDCGIE
jgi:hypothetical protein